MSFERIAPLALAATLLFGCNGNDPADNTPPPDPGGSCDGAAGESFAHGAVARNWELPDHLGRIFQLYDLCGKVIFLEVGSLW